MRRLNLLLLLIITWLAFSYCNDNKISFKRDVNNISTKTFYGIDKNQGNGIIIDSIIQDVTRAFKLDPINLSNADTEIRIYFISPFGEKFFQQKVINGNTQLRLFNCKTIRRDDSLFMTQDSYIEANGIYHYKNLNLDSIPKSTTIINDSPISGATDAGLIYLIQVKNKSLTKSILIKNPTDIEDKNFESAYSTKLLRQIKKNFHFHFYDSWDKIIDSAFIKSNQ